jgi:hypothetical protein
MSDVWYRTAQADESVTQRDIIFECPALSWRLTALQPPAGSVAANLSLREHLIAEARELVVMTQACDLEHAKVTSVVLCPHYGLEEFKDACEEHQRSRGQNQMAKAWRRYCDDIREGTIWNLNILNAQSDGGVKVAHRIVDFHEVFTLPRLVLESLRKARNVTRPQLLPPHLSIFPRRLLGSSCESVYPLP